MSKKKILLLAFLVLIVVYFIGPQPDTPQYKFQLPKDFPTEISAVENFIHESNSMHHIKPDNESKIIWADSSSMKTEYAIVYLHGFSASPGEGNPVNKDISTEYGMNIYIPRLADHGLVSKEPLLDFSGPNFMNSAYEALKLGELIGEKVIVMSCSTGSTAALFNMANTDVNIHANVMYSPNIKLSDNKAPLLSMPWGLQIARFVKGSEYNIWDTPPGAEKYWYGKYRLEATVELQNTLENCMIPSTFSEVTAPTFIGYYYKDESHQDHVVSVEAIKEMIEGLSVPKDKLMEYAFTEVEAHALQSEYFSKDISEVKNQTRKFFDEILKIKKP